MARHVCFPPAAAPDAEILILGSMPGRVSLEQQQYYAHPRNLFWPIMQQLFAVDSNEPYETRIKNLNRNRIALWDVINRCEREGSLDVNINSKTEEPNDIVAFLGRHQSIKKICFNGQKAFASFKRHILKATPSISDDYELIVLPSTSPANASISKQVKLDRWSAALKM